MKRNSKFLMSSPHLPYVVPAKAGIQRGSSGQQFNHGYWIPHRGRLSFHSRATLCGTTWVCGDDRGCHPELDPVQLVTLVYGARNNF